MVLVIITTTTTEMTTMREQVQVKNTVITMNMTPITMHDNDNGNNDEKMRFVIS